MLNQIYLATQFTEPFDQPFDGLRAVSPPITLGAVSLSNGPSNGWTAVFR